MLVTMFSKLGRFALVLAVVVSASAVHASRGPDWRGALAAGEESLPVSAFFDDARKRGFVQVGDFTSKIYQAWGIAVGDLDDDGTDEVVLGIWSAQKRHDEPGPHRTIWVLKWHEDRLVEAWRGSALSRPLVEFALVDLDDFGPHELAAYERGDEGCWLTAYRWRGFGFAGTTRAAVPCGGTLDEKACLTVNGITKCPRMRGQKMEFR